MALIIDRQLSRQKIRQKFSVIIKKYTFFCSRTGEDSHNILQYTDYINTWKTLRTQNLRNLKASRTNHEGKCFRK